MFHLAGIMGRNKSSHCKMSQMFLVLFSVITKVHPAENKHILFLKKRVFLEKKSIYSFGINSLVIANWIAVL